MPAVSEKIRTGLVELRAKSGSVYISPSLWERVRLLWTFRNFHSLPRQVLNHREQHLIDKLCRTGTVRRAPLTRASVIGAVENVELLPESQVETPTSTGKLVSMRVPLPDAVAPKAVGSEGISILSNRAVRDRRAAWGFGRRPSNVHRIREFRSYAGQEHARKEAPWTMWSANRFPAWGRWALAGVFALTPVWLPLHYRKNRPAASRVVTQGTIEASQAFSRSPALASASPLSKARPKETIPHPIMQDRVPPLSPTRTALRDQGKTSPTQALASPQPLTADDKSLRPERLRIREAPTSFDYPTLPDPELTGRVSLKAVIGRDGAVTTVDVLSGKPALAKAAIQAVKHWRYHTHEVDGNAVEAETNIEINFHGDEVVSVSYPGAQ
jgi:Gram-negative bacterial TonB protein C-terminal